METPHTIRSFARTKGHKTAAQKRSLEQGQQHLVTIEEKIINYQQLFSNDNPVIMEIGFGMGQATAQMALNNPHLNYLAVDVYEAGVGSLLHQIEQHCLTNIKIINADAVNVLRQMIAPNSLAAVHIFFPDPWPKKRHHKRRLLKAPFVQLLTKTLQSNGYLYVVTDWQNYAEEILPTLEAEALLYNTSTGYADAQPWRPKTKFERKGLEQQHSIYEMLFKKH